MPKEVDEATSEMLPETTEAVTDGNLLEKIGKPDYSGWMRKKGEKYATWKQRFFVLKGIYLYYLKSEGVRLLRITFRFVLWLTSQRAIAGTKN